MAKKTAATKRHRRTGLRKPKHYLKAWGDADWTRPLTPRLRVARVDEDLPFGKEGGRKSWYLGLTQDRDYLTHLGPVRGLPTDGRTLLLFEDDVVALVQYLVEAELVVLNPDAGSITNGPAVQWDEVDALRKQQRPPRRRAPRR